MPQVREGEVHKGKGLGAGLGRRASSCSSVNEIGNRGGDSGNFSSSNNNNNNNNNNNTRDSSNNKNSSSSSNNNDKASLSSGSFSFKSESCRSGMSQCESDGAFSSRSSFLPSGVDLDHQVGTGTATAVKATKGWRIPTGRRARSYLISFIETVAGAMIRFALWGDRMVDGCFPSKWHRRHTAFLVNASFNLAVFVQQLLTDRVTPRQGLLVVASWFASLSILNGTVSMITLGAEDGRWLADRHFRYAVLWKAGMLSTKCILLAMPVMKPVDMGATWSCGPKALCPAWCTDAGDGFCSKVGDSCSCIAAKKSSVILILTIITNLALLALNMQDVTFFCRHRLPPLWPDWRLGLRARAALLGAFGVNMAQFMLGAMLSFSPAMCYMLDFEAALQLAGSIFPLSLLANEAKWVLESWQNRAPQNCPSAPIHTSLGLQVFGWMSTSMCAIVAWRLSPPDPETCDRQCVFIYPALRLVLAAASFSSFCASLMIPNRRPPREIDFDTLNDTSDALEVPSTRQDETLLSPSFLPSLREITTQEANERQERQCSPSAQTPAAPILQPAPGSSAGALIEMSWTRTKEPSSSSSSVPASHASMVHPTVGEEEVERGEGANEDDGWIDCAEGSEQQEQKAQQQR